MTHRKKGTGDPVSEAFIREICALYGDVYDDRVEDSRPPAAGTKDGTADRRSAGADWEPGMPAGHKSLSGFQRELAREHGIALSTSKIRKILISGGCWTTERSREIQAMYAEMTRDGSGIRPEEAAGMIGERLGISKPAVAMNLPYINGVNRLEEKSRNAVRCARYRERKKDGGE